MRRYAALFALLAAAALLAGCRGSQPAETIPPKLRPVEVTVPTTETAPQTRQLIATVESLEKAQELAELYGIELLDYGSQIALFGTEEDPESVIQRGKDNGWPELSLNRPISAF